MSRKRPQLLEKQLKSANDFLARNKVKNQDHPLFVYWVHWLLDNKYYRGFNFHNIKVVEGIEYRPLAGSADVYDCLQIW